jgi:putative ABC transport system ATP-binding protein
VTAPLVSMEGISKTFVMPGGARVEALREVSFAIEPGDFMAIVGPSGSGKSTLMGIVGCLTQPTSGRYLLQGKPVSDYRRDELAAVRNRLIGFVFQSYNLLEPETALYNVLLPTMYRRGRMRDRERAAREKLELVGLLSRAAHLPGQLSGGEQQRVAIARALINDPQLLLADEPTGNLDTRTSIDVLALFQELNQEGVTLLLVTHERDIARYARRIVELRDGRVVRDTPVKDRRNAARDAGRDTAPPPAPQSVGVS